MKEIATAKQEAKNYDLFECYLAHLEEVEATIQAYRQPQFYPIITDGFYNTSPQDDPSEDEGVLNEKNSPVV